MILCFHCNDTKPHVIKIPFILVARATLTATRDNLWLILRLDPIGQKMMSDNKRPGFVQPEAERQSVILGFI
jgi:hypothetical protein